MLTKTVTGRKSLNAMLRHIAFHGHVEMPHTFLQHCEHQVLTQLFEDGKIVTARNGVGLHVLVIKNAMPYEESVVDLFEGSHPLVIHLALDNPKNEHLAKVFRANYVVPTLPEYVESDENELFLDVD